MAKIAFLGLGRMGAGMAGRFLTAGHRVAVFNRSAEKTAELVAAGAISARTPRAAARGADAIVPMVADGVESADAAGGSAVLGHAALDLFTRLVAAGHGELNESKLLDLLREES